MTHMREMSEHEGEFGEEQKTDRKCPKCGSSMTEKLWESSDGAYEDWKYTCVNKDCGYYFWIEGPDS
jgi:transposase-like protein